MITNRLLSLLPGLSLPDKPMPMSRKANTHILILLKSTLASSGLKETFRLSNKDFTRERKMPFPKVILFMMNLSRRSLQVDLTAFMRSFADGVQNVTASAFNQRRKKVDPLVFRELVRVLNTEFYTDNDERVLLWEGMRLLATDGSTLDLPQNHELQEIYGGSSNQHGVVGAKARCSVLYDVLNNLVIDGLLAPYAVGEPTLALEHLPHCGKGDLVIYDRGYPGFALIKALEDRQAEYLMRCKHTHDRHVRDFMGSDLQSLVIQKGPGKNTPRSWGKDKDRRVAVRMVKVLLDDGEVEVLLTSLIDPERYPTAMFKDLYHLRWGVERFYNVAKNIIRVEQFTGHTPQVVRQDFHCALFMSNIHALLVSEAQEELPAKHRQRKYAYKINNNVTFGYLKNEMVRIFIEEDPEQLLDALKKLFLSSTVPIRPGRHYPRNRDKYRTCRKPVCMPNSRPAL